MRLTGLRKNFPDPDSRYAKISNGFREAGRRFGGGRCFNRPDSVSSYLYRIQIDEECRKPASDDDIAGAILTALYHKEKRLVERLVSTYGGGLSEPAAGEVVEGLLTHNKHGLVEKMLDNPKLDGETLLNVMRKYRRSGAPATLYKKFRQHPNLSALPPAMEMRVEPKKLSQKI